MALRIRHTVNVRVARDEDMKLGMWLPDLTLSEVVLDEYERAASGSINIAAAATETLPLGDVDAVRGIYLEITGTANVRINGSLDNIAMSQQDATKPAKLFLEALIAQVQIENTGAAELNGFFCVWGDPTP